MSLICSLGWHSPGALARFNDGYYFSRCSRCGCDLVRPIDGDWRVPKGYRVVWRAPDGSRADAPPPKPIQAAPVAAAPEPELAEEIIADEAAVEEAAVEEAAEAAEPGEAQDIETIEPDLEASAHTIETIEPEGEAGDISQSEEPLVLTEEPAAEADEMLAESETVEEVEEAAEVEAIEESIDEVEEAEEVEAEAMVEVPAEAEEEETGEALVQADERGEPSAEAGAEPDTIEQAAVAEEDEAEEEAEEPAQTPGDGAGRLPIEAVLAHLRENPEPASTAAEPAAEPPPPPRPANPPPRNHWDFMGDTSEEKPEEAWDIPLPAEPGSPPQQGAEPAQEPEQGQEPEKPLPSEGATGSVGETIEPAGAERAETPRARPAAAFSHPRQWRGAAGMPKLRRSHVLLGAAVLGGLILAILAVVALADRFSAPSGLESELSGVEGPIPAGPDETAFVTASLLSCRAAPAREARRVKNLARGDRVRVLAHDGEWISLSHRGRQCWAMRRYTSAEQPL